MNGVQLKAVREAIAYAESQLQINHLLLHEGLRTDGVDLMLEQYGKTLSLSPSAQLYMAEMLSEHLLRICLLYTSPSPRDGLLSRMPSSA